MFVCSAAITRFLMRKKFKRYNVEIEEVLGFFGINYYQYMILEKGHLFYSKA